MRRESIQTPKEEAEPMAGASIVCQTKTVSVAVIVFNHEQYIMECLLSVLAQETSAFLEIIVCDDASTDDSNVVIADIVKNTTNANVRIIYYKNEKNVGMGKNFKFALSKCTGDYIAFCEGDDFWVDRHKIEKQIQLLNSGFDASFHDCFLVDANSSIRRTRFSNGRPGLEGRSGGRISSEMLLSSPIRLWHLASVMLRADICPFEIDWLTDFPVADYPFLATALAGKRIHYDPTPMAAYRKHLASVTAERTHDLSYAIKMDRVFRETKRRVPAKFQTYVGARRAANIVTYLNSLASQSLALRIVLTLPLCAFSRWSQYGPLDQFWLLKQHAYKVLSRKNVFKLFRKFT